MGGKYVCLSSVRRKRRDEYKLFPRMLLEHYILSRSAVGPFVDVSLAAVYQNWRREKMERTSNLEEPRSRSEDEKEWRAAVMGEKEEEELSPLERIDAKTALELLARPGLFVFGLMPAICGLYLHHTDKLRARWDWGWARHGTFDTNLGHEELQEHVESDVAGHQREHVESDVAGHQREHVESDVAGHPGGVEGHDFSSRGGGSSTRSPWVGDDAAELPSSSGGGKRSSSGATSASSATAPASPDKSASSATAPATAPAPSATAPAPRQKTVIGNRHEIVDAELVDHAALLAPLFDAFGAVRPTDKRSSQPTRLGAPFVSGVGTHDDEPLFELYRDIAGFDYRRCMWSLVLSLDARAREELVRYDHAHGPAAQKTAAAQEVTPLLDYLIPACSVVDGHYLSPSRRATQAQGISSWPHQLWLRLQSSSDTAAGATYAVTK